MPHRVLVLGSLNADLVVEAERLPRPGETLGGGDLCTYPGGKGANQALAAARLGARVSMAGAVGRDHLADLLLRSQQDAGVDCSAVARVDRPTGVALITVLPGGQNAILLSPGANHTVTPDAAEQACCALAKGDLLLCQLETPLEAVVAAMRTARARGATTMLDPAPAQEMSDETLALADILTPNETEAAMLTGLPADAEPDRIATVLLGRGPRIVILKRGERGSYVATHSGAVFDVPARAVEAVDTTAAGDVYNAALACALAEETALPDAVRFATAAAAISVTRRGAQPSAPNRDEVDALLSS